MHSDDSERRDHLSRRGFLGAAALAATGALRDYDGLMAEHAPTQGTLPTRPFGATGARIAMVGLGAGSRFYSSIPDDEQAADLTRRAIDLGLAFIETSANYGPGGSSERRLGLAMKTHRARVFLETKVDARSYDGAMR